MASFEPRQYRHCSLACAYRWTSLRCGGSVVDQRSKTVTSTLVRSSEARETVDCQSSSRSRSRARSLESSPALQVVSVARAHHWQRAGPCSHNDSYVWCNFDCDEILVIVQWARSSSMVVPHHCGNVSSQRMCLFLQVLQPLRDFVWLFLGRPPPGPAIFMLPEA